MSARTVIEFLRTVAIRSDLLDTLKVKSKDDVLAAAADFDLPFTEAEFDSVIWDLEVLLAGKRHEAFDAQFPLWRTMWGKYYLEYLVVDMIPSFSDADFVVALAAKNKD